MRSRDRRLTDLITLYGPKMDVRVVQLVSHLGDMYCLTDKGDMYVWEGSDPPGVEGAADSGWIRICSPADQAHIEFQIERERLEQEAKNGNTPNG